MIFEAGPRHSQPRAALESRPMDATCIIKPGALGGVARTTCGFPLHPNTFPEGTVPSLWTV